MNFLIRHENLFPFAKVPAPDMLKKYLSEYLSIDEDENYNYLSF